MVAKGILDVLDMVLLTTLWVPTHSHNMLCAAYMATNM